MKEQKGLTCLYRYQETRRRLKVLEERLSELLSSSLVGELSQHVTNLGKKVASSTEAISHLRREIKKMEDDCKNLDGRLRESETSLYSGKITSPKELTQLQMKIEEYRETRKKLDERLLQSMYHLEEQEEKVKKLGEEQNKSRQELERVEEELKQKKEDLQAEMNDCQKDLDELAPQIPERLRDRFFKMLERMDGLAVTPVKDGACGVCHVLVSPALRERLKKADSSMQTCENCGRLLFVGGDEGRHPEEKV